MVRQKVCDVKDPLLCFSVLSLLLSKFSVSLFRSSVLFSPLQKGYKLLDLEHNVFFISRDVTFFDVAFPFQNPENSPMLNSNQGHSQSLLIPVSTKTPELHVSHVDYVRRSSTELHVPPVDDVRRSSRTSRPPIWLKNYVRADKATQSNSCRYPIAAVIGYDQLSPKYQSYLSQISSEQEPNRYYEAAKDKRWIEAMQAEINALEDNKTWEIVPLPPRKRAIECKWVYKIKYKATGEVERFKSRLVARG
uniref:Reverse transcriptase Ty1/copia-type domain-containing protein n=1 Tax=Nicotiana tabacum TaxID=4097 RepID=A0A1S4DHW3_TOBAC|nr:PREDICTED: uncharacterized protein LOC107829880 [Nicotiana tabacum]